MHPLIVLQQWCTSKMTHLGWKGGGISDRRSLCGRPAAPAASLPAPDLFGPDWRVSPQPETGWMTAPPATRATGYFLCPLYSWDFSKDKYPGLVRWRIFCLFSTWLTNPLPLDGAAVSGGHDYIQNPKAWITSEYISVTFYFFPQCHVKYLTFQTLKLTCSPRLTAPIL